MKKISCLLLAAGQSSRMKGANKLLLSLRGKTLVRRTALEISKIKFRQVIAVTGFESSRIEKELEDLEIQTAYNEGHLSGMHSSIRTGLLHLTETFDGFFVCLSDQPAFDHHVLEMMINAFDYTQGERIIYPSFNGHRGQPVLIPQRFVEEILHHEDGDHGCSYLFKKYPELTYEVPMEVSDALFDVDTPEDFSMAMMERYA